MFKGVFTALVTPFKDQKIDYESLGRLVDDQIANRIDGLVVCGTTAESPTLTSSEQFEILDFICQRVNKKVPIIFGAGSNSTEKTVETCGRASEYPIDALLVVVPYYNKPPQSGLKAHFEKVADASKKPIVLYNVPGRTVARLEPETILALAKNPNIIGIKEADSDLNNFSKYKNLVPEDFCLLSGDDESCVSFCFLGGHGVISVCSNYAPGSMVDWIHRALEKDASVRDEFRQHLRWISNLYLTSNPIPVKAALVRKGLIATKEMRLPLVPLSAELEDKLFASLKEFGTLS